MKETTRDKIHKISDISHDSKPLYFNRVPKGMEIGIELHNSCLFKVFVCYKGDKKYIHQTINRADAIKVSDICITIIETFCKLYNLNTNSN